LGGGSRRAAVAQQEERVGLDCTDDLPKIELIVATVASGAALVIGVVLIGLRRLSAAWWTLAASIGCAAGWVMLGGFGAFDCVLDI
jgi:hypothetical protein